MAQTSETTADTNNSFIVKHLPSLLSAASFLLSLLSVIFMCFLPVFHVDLGEYAPKTDEEKAMILTIALPCAATVYSYFPSCLPQCTCFSSSSALPGRRAREQQSSFPSCSHCLQLPALSSLQSYANAPRNKTRAMPQNLRPIRSIQCRIIDLYVT